MYDIQELIKESVEQRIERILSDVQKGDERLNNLKKGKKRLVSKVQDRDLLLEYEEMESQERELLVKWVYKIAVNDSLDIVKSIINTALS